VYPVVGETSKPVAASKPPAPPPPEPQPLPPEDVVPPPPPAITNVSISYGPVHHQSQNLIHYIQNLSY